MAANWIIPTLIAMPMVAATLPLLSPYIRIGGRKIAAAVLLAETAMAALLASTVFGSGQIIYRLGGEALARPDGLAVGIELLADPLSALFITLAATVSLSLLAFTGEADRHVDMFYSLYLLIVGGLMGILLTHDIFTLFVFLEITGLSTYGLIASRNTGEAAVAALKYLMIGTAGASMYLIGVAYMYVATGTLNMTDLAAVLAGNGFISEPIYGSPIVLTGFGFMTVGLMVKTAIFPLHTWQPSAYSAASDDVTALMAALVSTSAAYGLSRLIFTVFTPRFFAANPVAAELIIAMAGISIAAGSILAVMQTEIKRLLAYSSVSQFGIIVAAFGIAAHPAGNSTALTGGFIHLLGHGVMKAGLFLGVGIIASRYGIRRLDEYAGLGKKLPIGGAALALLGISLIGVPPSLGFVGKWYIALGAVKSGLWPVAALILFSTMLTLLYVARILENLYFREPSDKASGARPYPVTPSAVLLLLIAVLAIGLGFAGQELYELLQPFISEVYN